MRFPASLACETAVVAVLLSTACRSSAPGPQALAPSPDESGQIGDSTALGVRIVGFSGARDRVTFMLDEPAYVVALAVVPGKTIEPVGLKMEIEASVTDAGVHEIPISVPRRGSGEAPPEPRLVDQVDYQKCVDRQVRSRRRPRTESTPVRDSTGKVIRYETTTVLEEELGSEREAERACSGILTRRGSKAAHTAGPNALPYGNRYLVLVASNARLTQRELLERLAAMTITAADAATTIAAVGEALYFDRRAVWSGRYIRW